MRDPGKGGSAFRRDVPAVIAPEGAPTAAGAVISFAAISTQPRKPMELNPVRQRIADLRGRLDALRGYL